MRKGSINWMKKLWMRILMRIAKRRTMMMKMRKIIVDLIFKIN